MYARADFITVHLPVTDETENWLDAAAFAAMRDGVRVINVARGKLMDETALRDALDSGQGRRRGARRVPRGAASPSTRCSATPTSWSRRTSAPRPPRPPTAPATRPPSRWWRRSPAGVVTSAVNVPAIAPEDLEALGPFLPLTRDLGRIASAIAERTSVDAVEVEYLGRVAERDTRLLTVQVLRGVLEGHTEEEVNEVNAPAIAEERGIGVTETSSSHARDFTDLIRVAVVSGGERTRVTGTTLGQLHRPHLLEAWGSRFNLQLEGHLAIFSYEDRPGMLGRVGTELGNRGINIISAAVGRQPEDRARAAAR